MRFVHCVLSKLLGLVMGLVVGTTLGLCIALSGCQKLTQIQDKAAETAQGGATAEDLKHTAAFKSSGQHGEIYLRDPKSCQLCHSKDLQAGARNSGGRGAVVVSRCSKCHVGFPHGQGFADPELHGAAYFEKKDSCAKCHREREGRANVRQVPTCASCHSSFPHADSFADPEEHGNAYLQKPATCATCHGPKLEGKRHAMSCQQCHNSAHTYDFKTTRVHGAQFKANPSACLGCHDANPPASSGGKRSCAICHENYPHGDDIQDSAVHSKLFRKNPADCARCHGEDFKGTETSPSCFKCHPSFPHNGRWGQPKEHGETFAKELRPDPNDLSDKPWTKTGCADCHAKAAGANRLTCSQCHIWHLEDGLTPHPEKARKPESGCTNCHVDTTKYMPHYGGMGCRYCHGPEDPVARWRTSGGSGSSALSSKPVSTTPKMEHPKR